MSTIVVTIAALHCMAPFLDMEEVNQGPLGQRAGIQRALATEEAVVQDVLKRKKNGFLGI